VGPHEQIAVSIEAKPSCCALEHDSVDEQTRCLRFAADATTRLRCRKEEYRYWQIRVVSSSNCDRGLAPGGPRDQRSRTRSHTGQRRVRPNMRLADPSANFGATVRACRFPTTGASEKDRHRLDPNADSRAARCTTTRTVPHVAARPQAATVGPFTGRNQRSPPCAADRRHANGAICILTTVIQGQFNSHQGGLRALTRKGYFTGQHLSRGSSCARSSTAT